MILPDFPGNLSDGKILKPHYGNLPEPRIAQSLGQALFLDRCHHELLRRRSGGLEPVEVDSNSLETPARRLGPLGV